MTNVLEGNTNTDRTDPAHSWWAHYTKSDAKRRDQRTQYRANWKGIMETPLRDIKNKTKNNNKIRTSAFSNSSMEICWKRRKEGRERDLLGRETQESTS